MSIYKCALSRWYHCICTVLLVLAAKRLTRYSEARTDLGSCRLENCTFGKLPLGKKPLGKYLISLKWTGIHRDILQNVCSVIFKKNTTPPFLVGQPNIYLKVNLLTQELWGKSVKGFISFYRTSEQTDRTPNRDLLYIQIIGDFRI